MHAGGLFTRVIFCARLPGAYSQAIAKVKVLQVCSKEKTISFPGDENLNPRFVGELLVLGYPHCTEKRSQSLNLYLSRYEYFNKGADLFVESLARLNHLLKVIFVFYCQ